MAETEQGKSSLHERGTGVKKTCQKIIFKMNFCEILCKLPTLPIKAIHNQDLHNTSGLLWPDCCFTEYKALQRLVQVGAGYIWATYGILHPNHYPITKLIS